MGGETFVTRGVRFDEINWSRPITIWCRFTVSAATSTGAARFTLGKANATGVGNLATRGIGFQVNNLLLLGLVHDGSTATPVSLGTLTALIAYDMRIESDGRGNVSWYLDDVYMGTTALGPTGTSTVDDTNWYIEAGNGADSAAQAFTVSDVQWTDG